MSEQITQAIAKQAQAKIDGCDCGGSGKVIIDRTEFNSSHKWSSKEPCPKCADLRALLGEITKEHKKCRHCCGTGRLVVGSAMGEPMFAQDHSLKCHTCHGKPDPTPNLTTAMKGSELLLKTWLVRAGLWEGFVEWLWLSVEGYENRTEILTNGELFTQAVASWLEVE